MAQLDQEQLNVWHKLKAFRNNFVLAGGTALMLQIGHRLSYDFDYHPFPILKPPIKTQSLDLFHVDDLAANKANVIGRRGQWRDYVDLFYLLKTKLYSLEKIINLARKKFGIEFNDRLFLQQLIYFDDLIPSKTEFLKKNYTDKQIKRELETQVSEFVRRKLSK